MARWDPERQMWVDDAGTALPTMATANAPQTAVQAVAQEPANTEPTKPKPDDWEGWKWDPALNMWRNDHDRAGYETWKNQQQAATRDAENTAARQEAISGVKAAGAKSDAATQDIINRFSAIQLDTGPADQARQAQERALGMQEAIYQKLQNYDPAAEAKAATQRATDRALAIARSAPGGAGARQASMFQALQTLPEIQAKEAETANATAARNTQLAAQAAAGYAQTAQGTRGQDINQAQIQADLGLQVGNSIAEAVGRNLRLTSEQAQFLGQLQSTFEGLDINWDQLDESQRAALVDEEIRKKGLSQQWQQFKESQKVGALDVLSAVTGTARSAVGTYASGKSAGLWGG